MWEVKELPPFETFGNQEKDKRRCEITTPSGVATVSTSSADYTTLYIDSKGIAVGPNKRLCNYTGNLTEGKMFEHLCQAARHLHLL